MDHNHFKVSVLRWLCRLVKAIPIAPPAQDPQAYEAVFDAATKVLADGDLLCIFPEGGVMRPTNLNQFGHHIKLQADI